MKTLLFQSFVLFFCNFVAGDEGPRVIAPQGTLEGISLISRKGRSYEGYLGIPYGTIPKRFEAGEMAGSWEGIREAKVQPPMCFQYFPFTQSMTGEEECLKLNVYTPNKKGKLPVMVWMTPGGFQLGGAALYEAKYFMDEDVVFVPINFRLGALGFLNTGEGSVSANNGLKDAVLALRWVSANIASFGGDPSRVTIFGESAGGAAVHYLTLSPLAKGLFHRAISASGSALNPWAYQPAPEQVAEDFVSRIGCDATQDWPSRVECLRGKTPEEIMEAQRALAHLDPVYELCPIHFIPSIESKKSKGPYFLTKSPYDILKSGDIPSKDVPYIYGGNENEGIFFTAVVLQNEELLQNLNEQFETIAPKLFYYDKLPSEKKTKVTIALKNFYFDGGKVKNWDRRFANINSDVWFWNGVAEGIDLHAKAGQRIWPYVLNYQGQNSLIVAAMGAKEKMGVGHADDLMYMFNGTFGSPEIFLGTKDGDFSEWFVDMLANFATNGEPGVAGWEELGKGGNLKFYSIEGKNKVKLVGDPLKERRKFWQNILGEKEREEL